MEKSEVVQACSPILAGGALAPSLKITKERPLHRPGCCAVDPTRLGRNLQFPQRFDDKAQKLLQYLLVLAKGYKPLQTDWSRLFMPELEANSEEMLMAAPQTRYRLALIFLLALCWISSPHSRKQALLHYRTPIHTSRTSRDSGRSRSSSNRNFGEAGIEPEIPPERVSIPLTNAIHVTTEKTSSPAARDTLPIALLPQRSSALHVRIVCAAYSEQHRFSPGSTLSFTPNLGRAPPLA